MMRRLTCLLAAGLCTSAWCEQQPIPIDGPTPPYTLPIEKPESKPVLPVVEPPPPRVPPPRTGQRVSLYSDDSFHSLTSDRINRRIGDLVTVLIYESASASSTADTGSARDATVGASVTKPSTGRLSVGLGTNNDFAGSGRTQREGRILAQLTVSVRAVLPNYDLMLAGEQLLEINGEKQIIRLEGRARPQDISELNTVISPRIADAKITFVGDGVVGDRQKPGWWQQLLGMFGL